MICEMIISRRLKRARKRLTASLPYVSLNLEGYVVHRVNLGAATCDNPSFEADLELIGPNQAWCIPPSTNCSISVTPTKFMEVPLIFVVQLLLKQLNAEQLIKLQSVTGLFSESHGKRTSIKQADECVIVDHLLHVSHDYLARTKYSFSADMSDSVIQPFNSASTCNSHRVSQSRDNCDIATCCESIVGINPLFIVCKAWRWPNLKNDEWLYQLPSCSARHTEPTKLRCINPYHWNRVILTTTDQDFTGVDGLHPVSVQHKTGFRTCQLPEISMFSKSTLDVLDYRLKPIADSCLSISALTHTDTTDVTELTMMDEPSYCENSDARISGCGSRGLVSSIFHLRKSKPVWGKMSFWESKRHVGRSWLYLTDNIIRILYNNRQKPSILTSRSAMENTTCIYLDPYLTKSFKNSLTPHSSLLCGSEPRNSSIASISSRRQCCRLGSEGIILTLTNQGRLWLDNHASSEPNNLPVFVSSSYLCDYSKTTTPRWPVYRVPPGSSILIHDQAAYLNRMRTFTSGSIKSTCLDVNPPPHALPVVHISLGKGWGSSYRRPDVSQCPARLELWLNGYMTGP